MKTLSYHEFAYRISILIIQLVDIRLYLGMADRAYVIPRVGFRSRISLGSLSIHRVAQTMNESKIETNMGFTKLLFNP